MSKIGHIRDRGKSVIVVFVMLIFCCYLLFFASNGMIFTGNLCAKKLLMNSMKNINTYFTQSSRAKIHLVLMIY